MRRASLSAVTLLALAGLSCAQIAALATRLPAAEHAPAVGAPAPDFTLADQHGDQVALSSLRGRQTVLVFYRGFW